MKGALHAAIRKRAFQTDGTTTSAKTPRRDSALGTSKEAMHVEYEDS